MKILLVEDNQQLAEIFKTVLRAQRYAVDLATDGQLGLNLAESNNYDLIVLDIMLPKLDGINLCRRLRSQGQQTPILMLTGRGTKDDRVTGLDAGADDYLIKPPDLDEFVARVRALLRRGQPITTPILEWGDLRLDPNQCEVSYGDFPLHFTPKEYAMLELFLRNSQRVYSRSALIEQIWSADDEIPSEETIRSHIKGVRQKLRAVGAADLIETVYGLGYRLNAAYAKKNTPSAPAKLTAPEAGLTPDAESSAVMPPSITQIWQQGKPKLIERLKELKQALKTSARLNSEILHHVEYEAHKLIGSLGAFGFETACQTARLIEQLARTHGTSNSKQTAEIHQQLGVLIDLVEQAVLPVANDSWHGLFPQLASGAASLIQKQPVLVVDDDSLMTDLLAAEAATYGLQMTVATTLEAAHAALRQSSFDAVVLDLALGEHPTQGMALLNYLAQHKPQLPVLVFTANDGLTTRIAVAELNVNGFLHKPQTARDVLEAIAKMLQPSEPAQAKILAVDDDPIYLSVLQKTLEDWGFLVTTLSDPQQFWNILTKTNPDLVILDVQMPKVSGIQLSQVLRNDLKWRSLPVLFLTSCNDAETVRTLFAAGADDYVNKPIMKTELLARLLNRLERTHLLRNQSEKDLLTDLPNRKRGTEDLHQWAKLADVSQKSFSLAVLRIDHLQQINQNYGHSAGDQILRRLGTLLRHELRPEDIVARWSGAEFVIGMYGMTRGHSIDWLAAILETFRQQEFMGEDRQIFHASFSAAVAQFPQDGTTLPLLQQAAIHVLPWVEQAGGDRIFPVTWPPPKIQNPQTQTPQTHQAQTIQAQTISTQTIPKQTIQTLDILVVHPDQTFVQQILRSLETRGYQSLALSSQSEALDKLGGKQPSLRASIILLAGDLANFDGFNLFKRLQKEKVTKNSRIVFLLNQLEEMTKMEPRGASDYILLPCSMSAIMLQLRQLMEP